MCAIFGFANFKAKENMSAEKFKNSLKSLTIISQARGKDSTGISTVQANGTIYDLRKVKSPDKYIKHPAGQEFFKTCFNRNTKVLIGHTRMATHGAVNKLNAQPFLYDNVLGSHNGIISNYKEVFYDLNVEHKTDCDSEVIFAGMSVHDTVQGKVDFLDELIGPYAIAFYDKRTPNLLYFARRDNPLTVIRDRRQGVLLWSSKIEYLKQALGIHYKDFEEVPIEDGDFMTIRLDNGDIEDYYTGYVDNSKTETFSALEECTFCGIRANCDYVQRYDCWLCPRCNRDI